jgi:uncharacterized protein
MNQTILGLLSQELPYGARQIENVVALWSADCTVPFMARYRKESTGGLDEVQIQEILDRYGYVTALEERKQAIIRSIQDQGRLTQALEDQIRQCVRKNELEDIYLPYRPKRRTKATVAIEKGLEPLAGAIRDSHGGGVSLEEIAVAYVNPEVKINTTEQALQGAGHIIAQWVAEEAEYRGFIRQYLFQKGEVQCRALHGKEKTRSKYEQYYDYKEPVRTIPSHRMLAIRRGEREKFLAFTIAVTEEPIFQYLEGKLIKEDGVSAEFLRSVIQDAYRRLIHPSLETELRLELKDRSEETAIEVFSRNLRALLLSPPAGGLKTLGIDPGLRTGCKLAVVDGTGRFLEHLTIYPHRSKREAEEAGQTVSILLDRHGIQAIAIGNGTASRETLEFFRSVFHENREIIMTVVDESGASVYSASAIARGEFPDLDVSVRGAISIARRFQDPLAELVKIDPKSIGVGQYQHDVDQKRLREKLDQVVTSCVNYVGVDLNTASWPLLSHVSGITPSLAKAIVSRRDEKGEFTNRGELREISRFSDKVFEQSAGFLRIRNGAYPLDNTGVHPERYGIVERMAIDANLPLAGLVGNTTVLETLDPGQYTTADTGLPTLVDILDELRKPGRDPRQDFVTPQFDDKVKDIEDLKPGMVLNGRVTNVTHFGAFVDIGIHENGLVHVSELAHRFVKNPLDLVAVGDWIQIKVLSIDPEMKRIALSRKAVLPAPADQKRREFPRHAKPEDPLRKGLEALQTKYRKS